LIASLTQTLAGARSHRRSISKGIPTWSEADKAQLLSLANLLVFTMTCSSLIRPAIALLFAVTAAVAG
jgi:hypothetical protein